MIRTSRAIAEEIGGLVGFAIVAWGRDGDLRSAYQIDNGPISAALLPTLVGDALNRHVSLEMAPATKLTGPR